MKKIITIGIALGFMATTSFAQTSSLSKDIFEIDETLVYLGLDGLDSVYINSGQEKIVTVSHTDSTKTIRLEEYFGDQKQVTVITRRKERRNKN